MILIPTFALIFVLKLDIPSTDFQSFHWSFSRWLFVDWPDCRSVAVLPLLPQTQGHSSWNHRPLCVGAPHLLRDKLSPERLLPLALLSLSPRTTWKQRIKHLPCQEVFICFHFLQSSFPGCSSFVLYFVPLILPLTSLLDFESSSWFHQISDIQGSS